MSMWGPPLAGDYRKPESDPDPDGPGLAGDYDQPRDDGSDDDKPKRSIWDDDQSDNPADGYGYQPPPDAPQNPPTGFWGAGGGGNPAWGAPSPGQRWGDDPSGGIDPRTGLPEAKRGSVSYSGIGFHRGQSFYGARKGYEDILERYDQVRHPGRRLKKKIIEDLEARMPHSEARQIMKDRNWL